MDIVERLSDAIRTTQSGYPYYGVPQTMKAAKKEIERLRAELGTVSEKLMIAGTENAGLRAERDAAGATMLEACARTAAAEAELVACRELLVAVDDYLDDCEGTPARLLRRRVGAAIDAARGGKDDLQPIR